MPDSSTGPSLLALLLQQRESWSRGERISIESLLLRQPSLRDNTEARESDEVRQREAARRSAAVRRSHQPADPEPRRQEQRVRDEEPARVADHRRTRATYTGSRGGTRGATTWRRPVSTGSRFGLYPQITTHSAFAGFATATRGSMSGIGPARISLS